MMIAVRFFFLVFLLVIFAPHAKAQKQKLLLSDITTHQSPVQINGHEFGNFYPPYLQSIKLVHEDGDVTYQAYLENPDSLQNEKLAKAAYKLLVLQHMHRALQKSIKQREEEYVAMTKRYTQLLEYYGSDLFDQKAIESVLEATATLYTSEGNPIVLAKEALFALGTMTKYLVFDDRLDNDWSIKLPNYPKKLLEHRKKLKGDPVKWAAEQVKNQTPITQPDLDNIPLDAEDHKTAGSYIKSLYLYFFFDNLDQGLEEIMKFSMTERFNEMLAAGAARYVDAPPTKIFRPFSPGSIGPLEPYGESPKDFLKGKLTDYAIDGAIAASMAVIDNADEHYLAAAKVEIELFTARRLYHLAHAQRDALYKELDEAKKEYQTIYDASSREAEQRELIIVADNPMKDGRYTMHLSFNKKVHLKNIKIGDEAQQKIHKLPGEKSRVKSSPKSKPDHFYTDYAVDFNYTKESRMYPGIGHRGHEYKDLTIAISAHDNEFKELDPSPESIPLYKPELRYNPNYRPPLNTRLLEDVEDYWEFHGNWGVTWDSTHKLKQVLPISVKATLKGAKPEVFEVR